MDSYETRAFGKINLGLDVMGRLENGYHEVNMIMQTVRLCDRLCFEKLKENEIRIQTNLGFLPVGSDNLVYRAVELVRTEFGITEGVSVRLQKHIPVAAGMAGGSSDAAAAIRSMNLLFDLGMGRKKMMELGVRIGADVPYCIMGGTAVASGIGEKLKGIADAPQCHVLLVKPPVSLSTRDIYTALDSLEQPLHPRIDVLTEAIERGDFRAMCENMGNTLEEVSIRQCPEIAPIKERMLKAGAAGAMMSGSGPTVFGLFDDEEKARCAFGQFKAGRYGRNTFLTEFKFFK